MADIPYPNAGALFYQQYESVRRDEVVGILLALFLGVFGVHHFYLRRTGLGILYCFFFWTGITAILGFIECFFMPSRVREFNAIQAAAIAAALGMAPPAGFGWPAAYSTPYAPAAAAAGQAPAGGMALPLPGAQVVCKKCQGTNVAGSRFCFACGSAL